MLLGVLSGGTDCQNLAINKDDPKKLVIPKSQMFTSVVAHSDEIDSFIGDLDY